MQPDCLTLDFQFSSSIREQKSDPIERAKHEISLLENENLELENEISSIKSNPQTLIKSLEVKLLAKIRQLREENQGIESLIEKSKIPGYAEMTKKKPLYGSETPNKEMRSSINSEWADFEKKNPFESIDMSQKFERSTCQNFPIQPILQNPIQSLQPIQDLQLQARTHITMQLLQVVEYTSRMENSLQKMQQQEEQVPSSETTAQPIATIKNNLSRIKQIQKYKKKLLTLLQRLKQRESNIEQIVREYRRMHEQTFLKLKQATQIMQSLSSAHVDANIDHIYAQVVQLEQKLRYINEQLQKLDEDQWLKNVLDELMMCLRRLGIKVETDQEHKEYHQCTLKQKIDYACEILIECALNQKADEHRKLTLLKHYQEEEKEINKKIVKKLQNKEQALSKKLIDLQMNG